MRSYAVLNPERDTFSTAAIEIPADVTDVYQIRLVSRRQPSGLIYIWESELRQDSWPITDGSNAGEKVVIVTLKCTSGQSLSSAAGSQYPDPLGFLQAGLAALSATIITGDIPSPVVDVDVITFP